MWHEQQQELSKNAGHGRSGWADRAHLKQQRGRPCSSWGVGKGRVQRGETRARSGRGVIESVGL